MRRIVLWLTLIMLTNCIMAQNPQAPTGTPVFGANAQWVNGVAPGYAPIAGSGLNLALGPGTANCSGTIETYAGGTIALTASTTNNVYLNTSSSCGPAVKTTAFTASDIPIAAVVTGASTITSIADVRTPFISSTTAAYLPLSGGTMGGPIQSTTSQFGNGPLNGKSLTCNMTGNGSTDDSTAFQTCVTYGKAHLLDVYLPSGTYLITKSINATGGNNFHIYGDSQGGTLILHQLTEAYPVLDFSNCSYCGIRNIKIYPPSGNCSNSSATAAVAVFTSSAGGGNAAISFQILNSNILAGSAATHAGAILAGDLPVVDQTSQIYACSGPGAVVGGGLSSLATAVTSKFITPTGNGNFTNAQIYGQIGSDSNGPALDLTASDAYDFGDAYLYGGTTTGTIPNGAFFLDATSSNNPNWSFYCNGVRFENNSGSNNVPMFQFGIQPIQMYGSNCSGHFYSLGTGATLFSQASGLSNNKIAHSNFRIVTSAATLLNLLDGQLINDDLTIITAPGASATALGTNLPNQVVNVNLKMAGNATTNYNALATGAWSAFYGDCLIQNDSNPAGEPVCWYPPPGTGPLAYGAFQNLAPWSNSFSAATWTLTGSPSVTTNVADPWGGKSATTISSGSAWAIDDYYSTTPLTASTNYTVCVYAQAASNVGANFEAGNGVVYVVVPVSTGFVWTCTPTPVNSGTSNLYHTFGFFPTSGGTLTLAGIATCVPGNCSAYVYTSAIPQITPTLQFSPSLALTGQLPLKYSPSLTPAAATASACAEQTFTVTGLVTSQNVLIAPPSSMGANLWIGAARVSTANTLAVSFCANATGGTPPSGTWLVLAY